MTRAAAAPVLLALALRLVPILVADRVVVDIERYQRVGRHLLDVSPNPYETRRLYPYPPLWAPFEAGAEWLSRHGFGSFAIDVKLPVLLADLLIVLALVAAGRPAAPPPAAAWIYAVHPVSVLVTGFHGQFDSIALLFVLLATDALARGGATGPRCSWPPRSGPSPSPSSSFPSSPSPGRLHGGRRCGTPFSPRPRVALLLLPFAIADLPALRRELLAYSGIADFGWTGFLRGVTWLATGDLARSEARFWPVASAASKVLFLAAWGALVLATRRGWLAFTPARASLATFVAFNVFYGALSAQYLLWVVPLAVLWPGRALASHAAAATARSRGLLPLSGAGSSPAGPLTGESALWAGRLWVVGTGATLGVSGVWLVGLLREGRAAAAKDTVADRRLCPWPKQPAAGR